MPKNIKEYAKEIETFRLGVGALRTLKDHAFWPLKTEEMEQE